MKNFFTLIVLFFLEANLIGQNITVDSQLYTPQELIENILIDSNCITDVVVNNVVGGNFGGTELSYGYFDANGSSFPFQSGLVLSTGRLSNVPGPNNTLSDDDAPGWLGDSDLENLLNENNTFNATIIEFQFRAIANRVSFRYLFASEEYQENNVNTCRFSDLFGFLIRNVNDAQYENIALVPDTQTEVKVTTVHPGIPGSGGCEAINESYFGSFNTSTAPINFNGQTAVLSASSDLIPGETYQVKLVIADEENFRFDSAVFLEAGSFRLNTDLGANRLILTNNALCEGETLELDASESGNNAYSWYKDGVLVDFQPNTCLNCGTYNVTESGTYNVEVELENGCLSYGAITIEYLPKPIVFNTALTECDDNLDGLSCYNLFDAEPVVTNGDNTLLIENFFQSVTDAEQNIDEIDSPLTFENTSPIQVVYARVVDQARCFSIAEITLNTSNNAVIIPPFDTCDDAVVDGIFDFNETALLNHVTPFVPVNSIIGFYRSLNDALKKLNRLDNAFENLIPNSDTIYVRIDNNLGCYGISSLELNVLFTPLLLTDETTYYCEETFPSTISLNAGIINDNPNNYSYEWIFNNQSIPNSDTSSININEAGIYEVIATYGNGCSSSRMITVEASGKASIDYQLSNNNTVTVNAIGLGNYEYALDNQDFLNNNVFTNVKPGFHTIFVSDINGCEISEKKISILGFPRFFTPNNDGIHETWKPYGVNAEFFNGISIKIFDRYGKLLKQLSATDSGWNGNFNGTALPTDDYWFKVVLADGNTYMGHFSLKR
ncbi:choice-of-anchor L domain-containing protein [Hyunsoonleella aestuarii]|uniref:Choice-of-anchor L domain-containing protein n=1 Tax=Hyunsoonleella aestuarii TaxID=912802 RepID=A0ABP8EE83_9FLAO